MKGTKGKAKRLLAGLLCVAMLAACLPMTALATQSDSSADGAVSGEVTLADVEAAVEAAEAEAEEAEAEEAEAEDEEADAANEESEAEAEADEAEAEAEKAEEAEEAGDESNAAVTAAETTSLHLATYYNQLPTLPETVDGNTVTWPELEAEEFTDLYDTVEVTGQDEDGNTVTAVVEVVPEDLVYFIDSGTGEDWKTTMAGTSDESAARTLTSEAYEAVQALVGDSLLNQVSDQAYDEGEDTWGYGYVAGGNSSGRAEPIQSYCNNNTKPDDYSTTADKYDAGLRASTSSNFSYYLTLEAGTYTLTTGFHEFYNGSHNRSMQPTVMNAETGEVIAEFDVVAMSNNANSTAAPDLVSTGIFTLEEDTVVQVYYAKISGENGSMNWLAVAKGEGVEEVLKKSSLRSAVKGAETYEANLDDYASISQNALNRALETARDYLARDDSELTQDKIDAATEQLETAISTMVVKDVDENRYTSVPVGETWLDTEGAPIQAHGGGFLQQTDADGTPIYYWVGEDKTHNASSFNGVNLYCSKDLLNWTYMNTILAPDLDDEGLSDNKIERPKLLYNEATGKYVLWGHWEDQSGYTSSQVCVAVCDTVDGDYEYLGHWRPGASDSEEYRNWRVASGTAQYDDGTLIDDYSDTSVWGYGSRDFTLYMEDDGTTAYLVTTQDAYSMRIYKLNDSFTDVVAEETELLFENARREAPALTKIGDYYFLITSAQSGWYPNQARYSYTTDLMDADAWTLDATVTDKEMPSGLVGNNTTFYSQPTNIMQITGSEGTSFIYMGDRWNSDELGSSTYVWLPLTVEYDEEDGEPVLTMEYVTDWSLDVTTGSVVLAETELLSENKPSSTNAYESSDDSLKLYRANDGDYTNQNVTGGNHAYFKPVTSSGGSTAKVPFTYTIDLEGVYDLSRVDISFNCHNGSECYYQYTVDVSLDNSTWVTAVDESGNTTVGFKSDDLSGYQARYVRISVSKVVNDNNGSSASWAAGLVEVQVYGGDLEPTFTWAEDYSAATAAFTINGETVTVDAEVTSETTTAASCTGEGEAVYTATATYDGLAYADSQTVTLPATGHTWDEGTVTKEPTTEEEGEMTYTCTVCGETKTEAIDKLEAAFEIVTQPEDVSAEKGSSATFTVVATGADLTYQWQYKTATGSKWYNCTATTGEGYASSAVTLTANAGRDGYKYRCVVTNGNGETLTSDAAELTVTTPAAVDSITITVQPEDVTAEKGSSVTFTVEATGSGLTYQWQYKTATGSKWYNCTATTGEGYASSAVTLTANKGRNGYQYRCKITDENGNVVYSDAVTLTVTAS